jgi:1,4-dihydroxy-2-naphthoate octaprenyltransferase
MPVFLFALGISIKPPLWNIVLVFLVLHLFIYPASNGYNSYFDKDEKSIGGLRQPPKVQRDLYYAALVFDIIGILLALYISWQFAVLVFIYGLVSKAYSHPKIRIKKLPWTSWVVAGVFQGFFTFLMSYLAINNLPFRSMLDMEIMMPAVLSTVVLLGSYPMTQVYQHDEDQKRGDVTLSFVLGVKGTFLFTAGMFLVATLGFFAYFKVFFELKVFFWFLAFMAPILLYFNWWFLNVLKRPGKADFTHTMNLNMISSVCLGAFFILLFFYNN